MSERDTGTVGRIWAATQAPTMRQMLRFNNHIFYVRGRNIKSFRDLKIKATVNTEEVEDAGDRYVRKKTNGSIEVNFVAIFSTLVENDVKYESLNLIQAAQSGESGYLYFADGGQVWPFALMVTEAEMNECIIGAGGIWTYATVRVTMKQCELNAGGITPEEVPEEDGGDKKKTNLQKKAAEVATTGVGIIAGAKQLTGGKLNETVDLVKKWTTPAKDTVNKPNTNVITPKRKIKKK